MTKRKFTYYRQLNEMDCGPTCLRMIAKYYGKFYNSESIRKKTGFSKRGVSLLGISETAEKMGFRSRGIKTSIEVLRQIPYPIILHWDQNHFVVLINVNKKKAIVADPRKDIINYGIDEFSDHWCSSTNESGRKVGIALLLEPTSEFFNSNEEKQNKLRWKLVLQYLLRSRNMIFQVFIALLIVSFLQLIFPFLTQSIVDIGINTGNLNYIIIILVAQLTLTLSKSTVEFIRSRILLKISNTLNLQILSDFWIKLTKLPISYFDIHHTGDTMQRIVDHKQIQNFLTDVALNTFFSILTFIIYSAILIIYNVNLFIIFILFSIVYFFWIFMFLNIRRRLNYETFHLSAKENNTTLELIQGMQEIRLNNAEKQKRWEWENIQASVFRLNFKNLNYSQWQNSGATLITQIQGIIISFIVAKLVIDNKLSLGSMLAVQYIIGQLSGPIQQWVGFIQNAQDAKISMERLNEIHDIKDEEDLETIYIENLPKNKSIQLINLSFAYPGIGNDFVLKNIDLQIPENKLTAIVGSSGSGKTTLLKLLLKVYSEFEGNIRIGVSEKIVLDQKEIYDGIDFNKISPSYWRRICGTVLQDGYIFNDNIAKNIAVGDDNIDYDRLLYSAKTANIYSFIESLPNGFYTNIGVTGMGISQGQKQRILIARAIYKNPQYLFFDEATNALDANNEKEIIENLENFFKEKTVVVAAHRLSTVKNADKIIVLENGKIVENGNHDELISLKGKYYELVKNQLELEN